MQPKRLIWPGPNRPSCTVKVRSQVDIWAEARIKDTCRVLASQYKAQAKEGDTADERTKKLEDDLAPSAKTV